MEVRDLMFKGNTDRPQLSGSVLFDDMTLQYADLHDPIENISGALRADGSRLVLENLAGVLSGKTIALQGGVAFDNLEPSFVLELQDVEDLPVSYKNIYKGRLDVRNLRLEGTMDGMAFEPLAGTTGIRLHHGSFTLVPLGENAAAATSTYEISVPGNNLVIEAGDSFVARTPGNTLYVRPRGAIRIGGRMAAPEEMAGIVAFLLSDDASMVTGTTQIADGGTIAALW